jgi:hypothetical protein
MGRDPAATVYPTMAILTDSLLAHAGTVALTLAQGQDHLTLVLDTLTRAILESASQIWWLGKPGIGGRARVARLAVVRRMSAMAYEKTVLKMGAHPDRRVRHHGRRHRQLLREHARACPRGRP